MLLASPFTDLLFLKQLKSICFRIFLVKYLANKLLKPVPNFKPLSYHILGDLSPENHKLKGILDNLPISKNLFLRKQYAILVISVWINH